MTTDRAPRTAPAGESAPAEMSRRHLLTGAVGVCAALALGAGQALLADDARAADGITRLPDGRVRVQPSKIPALASVGGAVRLGTVRGVPVALVRTGTTSYAALDLRCTHQGVTVRRAGQSWSCPAHGSTYAADGGVTNGPAVQPLARVAVKRSGTRLLVG